MNKETVNNFNYNSKKLYELFKQDAKIILNTASHCLVIAGLIELSILTGNLAVLAASGIAIAYTIHHIKKSNDEIIKTKKRIK